MQALDVVLSFLLANNLVFYHFFGVKEVLQPKKNLNACLTLVLVLAVHLTIAALFLWSLETIFLQKKFSVLRAPIYTMVLWFLCELYSVLTNRWKHVLPEKREIFLNSALLGGILTVCQQSQNVLDVFLFSLSAVVGYGFSFFLLWMIELRLLRERIPNFIQGLPLQLFTCGLIALMLQELAFHFSGTGR